MIKALEAAGSCVLCSQLSPVFLMFYWPLNVTVMNSVLPKIVRRLPAPKIEQSLWLCPSLTSTKRIPMARSEDSPARSHKRPLTASRWQETTPTLKNTVCLASVRACLTLDLWWLLTVRALNTVTTSKSQTILTASPLTLDSLDLTGETLSAIEWLTTKTN